MTDLQPTTDAVQWHHDPNMPNRAAWTEINGYAMSVLCGAKTIHIYAIHSSMRGGFVSMTEIVCSFEAAKRVAETIASVLNDTQ